MEFTAPMAPNMPEVEVPVPNESSMSNYCRFAQAVLSGPPMEVFDGDVDPLDRVQVRFILYVESALWRQVMQMKDL